MNLSILPVAEIEAAEAAVWYDGQKAGLGDVFLAELAMRSMAFGTSRRHSRRSNRISDHMMFAAVSSSVFRI